MVCNILDIYEHTLETNGSAFGCIRPFRYDGTDYPSPGRHTYVHETGTGRSGERRGAMHGRNASRGKSAFDFSTNLVCLGRLLSVCGGSQRCVHQIKLST